MLSRPAVARLFALLLALAGLAGCGGGSSSSSNGVASKSPEQIVEASKAAAAKAASVHVTGSTISENKPISLDMELVAGKGAKGHISIEGLRIDIVELEHAFYLNGSPAFYSRVAGPAAAQLLEGKWLKAPTSSGNFASLSKLTDLATADRLHARLATARSSTRARGRSTASRRSASPTRQRAERFTSLRPERPTRWQISKGGKEGGPDRLQPLERAGHDHSAAEPDQHQPAPERPLSGLSVICRNLCKPSQGWDARRRTMACPSTPS